MNQRKRPLTAGAKPIDNALTQPKPMRGPIANSVAYKPKAQGLGKIKGAVTSPK